MVSKKVFFYYIVMSWLIQVGFLGLVPTFITSFVTMQFRYVWALLGVVLVLAHKGETDLKQMHFRSEVAAFMFLPLMSGLSANIHYQQTFIQSFTVWIPCLTWVIYYGLHAYKLPPIKIELFLVIISLIILGLQIGGQLLGRKIGVVDTSLNDIEVRNDLFRFRYDTTFALFCLFMYWERYLLYFKRKYIVLTLLMLTSIYLSLTRMRILAAIVPLILSYFLLLHKRFNFRLIITFIPIVFILYYFRESLFGFFVHQTSTETESGNNIRDFSMAYYWSDVTNDWIKFFIGNGIPHENSRLGLYLKSLHELGFFADDVGIVGQWWYYGFLYIWIWGVITYKILWSYRRRISLHVILYFIGMTIISFYFFPLAHVKGWIIWSILLYLTDADLNNNPKRKCVIKQ